MNLRRMQSLVHIVSIWIIAGTLGLSAQNISSHRRCNNLGVNPSLTICALTERAMTHIPNADKQPNPPTPSPQFPTPVQLYSHFRALSGPAYPLRSGLHRRGRHRHGPAAPALSSPFIRSRGKCAPGLRHRFRLPQPRCLLPLPRHLATIPVFLALGLPPSWRRSGKRASTSPKPAAKPLPTAWLILFLAIFAAFFLAYFFNALAPEISPDGSGYHLGNVARYWRHHGFAWDYHSMYSYLSQGAEMLFLVAFTFGRPLRRSPGTLRLSRPRCRF